MSGLDNVLNSNLSSNLLRTFWFNQKNVASLSYAMPASFPNVAYYTQVNLPYAGTGSIVDPSSQTIQTYVSRDGLWQDAEIKLHGIIKAADAAIQPSLFRNFMLFQQIALYSGNSVLITLFPEYLYCRTVTETLNNKLRVQKATNLRLHTTYQYLSFGTQTATKLTGLEVDTALPLYLPCFESVYQALDLGFVEQLRIISIYNSQNATGWRMTGFGSFPIGTLDYAIYNKKFVPDTLSLATLKETNFRESKQMSYLWYDVRVEKQRCTITTSNNLLQQLTYAVRQSWLMVRQNGNAQYDVNPLRQIIKYNFMIGGTIYTPLSQVESYLEDYFTEREYSDLAYPQYINIPAQTDDGAANPTETPINLSFGQNGDDTTEVNTTGQYVPVMEQKQIVHVVWGAYPNERTRNTGCLSYSSLNQPQFNVTTVDLGTASNYDLVVVSEYMTTVEINKASGQIMKSLQI